LTLQLQERHTTGNELEYKAQTARCVVKKLVCGVELNGANYDVFWDQMEFWKIVSALLKILKCHILPSSGT